MKNIIFGIGGAIIGAAAGFAAGWFYTKKKYENLANKAVEEYKQYLESQEHDDTDDGEITLSNEVANAAINKDLSAYKEKIKQYNTLYSSNDEKPAESIQEEENQPATTDAPYEIDGDFYEKDDFHGETMYFFEDGTFTSDDYMPYIDADVVDYLGEERNKMLDGDYDSIYVRNPKYGKDFVVLRDLRTYKEFLEDNPRIARLVNLGDGFDE